ncbi:MAG TPA: TA system VapC family ribonuclease toxin [Thermoanaerobaculia bacterium]|nr:TA system VapC family ribonuclease toxin [Thermoanaerobaculia bacterium]
MSFAVDANLLVYGSNRDSPYYEASRGFLEERVRGREIFCIAWQTAMAYLRIVTHRQILPSPLSPREALRNLAALEALPHVRMLGELKGFLSAYVEATGGEPLRGNLVPDAHLAAVLLQHDVRTLYTHDSDFRRFSFLDVRNPLAAKGP